MKRATTAISLIIAATCSAQPELTVPDRTIIAQFLGDSSIVLPDLNGDCAVSDVDAALVFNQRLVTQYGAELAVGDRDGNGVVDGEDVVDAIAAVLWAAFGNTDADDEEVNASDAFQIAWAVQQGDISGDVNLDGLVNALDVMIVHDRIGDEVSWHDIDQIAREIFSYVGAVRELGPEWFMAAQCVPKDHLPAISDLWPPDHPKWWKPNHSVAVSESYNVPPPPGSHTEWITRISNPPQPHVKKYSSAWPPNHIYLASRTWPIEVQPNFHTSFTSHYYFTSHQEPPPPDPTPHASTVSAKWHPGHFYEASNTLPPGHAVETSRTWWPNHTYADSVQQTHPPLHVQIVSERWVHTTELSQGTWPPNHDRIVSQMYGPAHNVLLSAAYPLNHHPYVSSSWPVPGTTNLWPPNHLGTVSKSWGDPPNWPWPVFPPGHVHSWYTTYKDLIGPLIPPLIPRIPWP